MRSAVDTLVMSIIDFKDAKEACEKFTNEHDNKIKARVKAAKDNFIRSMMEIKAAHQDNCSEIERMQGDVRLLQLQMIKSRQDLEGVTNTPWKEAITKFINFSTLNHKMPLESATGSGIGSLADCAELFP